MVKKVIVVGAGFGGLEAVQRLKKADVEILLIDKVNHHLFQPLLYQVATGALSPADIAIPIRQIFEKQNNLSFLMGTVIEVNKEAKTVTLENGMKFPFDYLILAPGASHSYFGNDEWKDFAPGMKSVHDALLLREKIFSAFERAERTTSPEEMKKLLTFIIIGAGPTGVELAGTIQEIAIKHMDRNYRHISPNDPKVYLIEAAPHVLPQFSPELSKKAEEQLSDLGVIVKLNTKVTKVVPEGIFMGDEFIATPNVIWAAGNQASPLLKNLNVPLDRQGRVIVDKDLSIPGNDHIFVVGDAAHCKGKDGNPYPGLAPVAKQEGRFVADIIKNNKMKDTRGEYHYVDKGNLAVVKRGKAVGSIGPLKISGFFAWFVWCMVHIFYLVGFRNRLVVMMQWGFWYFAGRHKVELLTNPLNLPFETPLE